MGSFLRSKENLNALIYSTCIVIVFLMTVSFFVTAQPVVTNNPEIVIGLPDFTNLVNVVKPGVVTIEAKVKRNGAHGFGEPPKDSGIPEIFRRFFDPRAPFSDRPGGGDRQRPEQYRISLGTGFIISSDGYVLTNHHVIDGVNEVKIKLSDQRKLTAKVIGSDAKSDVALLKVDASGLSALNMGDSSQLQPGQWAVAIGSPFGLEHSVTAGIISAVGRSHPNSDQQYVPFIQTDVAINRGNSGGPLLNIHGEVIGINSQIFSNSGGYMGVSFAIPINLALGVVEQLKETGQVRRGMIGVTLQKITPEIVHGFDLDENTHGALITKVIPGSPGEKAGLKSGDIIQSVNSEKIVSSDELPPVIGAMAPGTKVTLGIIRDNKPRKLTVVLGRLGEQNFSERKYEQDSENGISKKTSNPLGLILGELSSDDRKQLDIEPGQGVGIIGVEGASARNAGILPGDVVLSVGRQQVGKLGSLGRALAALEVGETVILLISRNGNRRYIAVTVDKEGSK